MVKKVIEPNEIVAEEKTKKVVPWGALIGLFYVLAIYFSSQIVGSLLVIYPKIMHWSTIRSNNWLNNSVFAQFIYVFIVEAYSVAAILLIMKWYKASPKLIGLRKPKWKDPLYGLGGLFIYYPIYIISITVATSLFHSLNVSQQQDLGFGNVHGVAQLVVTFISLVILPPITEEIMVRGFLYSSMKKGLPQIGAALVTSLIFATAHLPEGQTGILWVAGIDTFILSTVLIYLREKTGGLWASMTLHGIKNSIAYLALYILPLIR